MLHTLFHWKATGNILYLKDWMIFLRIKMRIEERGQEDSKWWMAPWTFCGCYPTPETSVYYPFCDCEDRAILLSRLVRYLLGLRTLLVFYPGHLAMAVAFNEKVEGDYIVCQGQRFVVCDPTYIGAPVGATMTDMDNAKATVVLLEPWCPCVVSLAEICTCSGLPAVKWGSWGAFFSWQMQKTWWKVCSVRK